MSSSVVYRNPADYDSSNKLHIRDATQALDKYSHLLRWKEGETAVDVGSGSGNVTTTVLAPRLPTDYKLLVGFDISEYNKKYASDNNTDLRTKFIQGDIIQPDLQMLTGYFKKENIKPEFDKIFSLHCLHWVTDSKQWSKNIYELLKPGGQTFLMFITHASFIEMWIEVACSKKWAAYTKATGPYRNEFQYSSDIDNDLTKIMSNAGFIVEHCEHYECYFDPDWPINIVHKLFTSSDPYVHTIPGYLHSDYFEDLLQGIKKLREKNNKDGMPYTTSVIIASKPGIQMGE